MLQWIGIRYTYVSYHHRGIMGEARIKNHKVHFCTFGNQRKKDLGIFNSENEQTPKLTCVF
jgi:hypothetical protein